MATDRKLILAYNLTKEQIATLIKLSPQCDYRYVEVWSDFIAISSSLVIADMSDISAEDRATIFKFYKEIEPSPEHLIITGGIDENSDPHIKSVDVISDFWDDESKIKTTLLKVLHDTAKDVDISTRLSRLLIVQKIICENPRITTKEIAANLEVSERSVKRYIDTLRMSGADIRYTANGWHSEIAVWDCFNGRF